MKALAKNNFKQKFWAYHKKMSKITSLLHDEKIFWLLMVKESFNVCHIPNEWNCFFRRSFTDNEIIFLHLQYKPWKYKFLWEKISPIQYPVVKEEPVGNEEYQRRRIRYRKLYMNFCKKYYGYKFYLYFFEDLIPITEIFQKLFFSRRTR